MGMSNRVFVLDVRINIRYRIFFFVTNIYNLFIINMILPCSIIKSFLNNFGGDGIK